MIRLAKFIARAGVASRRGAEVLIKEGKVKLNGKVVLEPATMVDPREDRVQVGNRELLTPFSPIYILLNKPKGVVTTLKDPQGRMTVRDLLKGIHRRLFPVGRLDYHTEGVLLLTNDGDMAHRLLHPSFRIERVYQAKLRGVPDKAVLERIREGVELEPGVVLKARARLLKILKANSWLELVLYEGRYREVRRMCEAVGHPVLALKRTRFGPLSTKGLPLGAYRHLTAAELELLHEAVKKKGRGLEESAKNSIPSKTGSMKKRFPKSMEKRLSGGKKR
jgi:23S rRNA pseudouridine2605 synthase